MDDFTVMPMMKMLKEIAKINSNDTTTNEEKEKGFNDLVSDTVFDIENFDLLEVIQEKVSQDNYFMLQSIMENEELAEKLKNLDMFEDLQEKILAYEKQFL